MLRSLLNRPKAEQSSTKERGGSVYRRTAGVTVNEDTALTYSAVYLSTKIIAETLAALPSNVFTRIPGTNNREVARNHYLHSLLLQPNNEMTGFTFLSTMISHAVLRGGGFAFIDRDRANRPVELMLLTPDRVNKARSRETGKIVYEVANGNAANSYYDESQILHLPGMGYDGLVGYSVVGLAARSFGLGMAAEEFGASFYENGASLGTVIEVPPEIELDEDGKNLLVDSFDEKHKGVRHHHRTALVDQGMKVSTVGIPQKDAQFIESRKFSVTDVARWFNMPPHKLKDLERATFSNIEEQNIDFVQDTLMPWIVNLEQVINWKLIGINNRNQFFKLNVNGLLRGDAKSRAEYYQTRFNMGSLSINEIKAYEDENGIGPDGDQYFMQVNMTTVDKVVNPPELKPAPMPAPALPGQEGDDNNQDEPTNLDRFRPLVNDAVGKIVHNISERVVTTAKKAGKTDAEVLAGVLLDRASYVEKTVEPIVWAVADVDRAHVTNLVHILITRLATKFTDATADDLRAALAGDFMAFCATITENKAGDE